MGEFQNVAIKYMYIIISDIKNQTKFFNPN